jgi:RND family efflux transporter MFP subunit
MRNHQPLVIALSLLSLCGLSACQPAVEVPNSADERGVAVKVYRIDTSQQQRLREFPALVEAAQVAQLAFRVGGELAEFPAKAGHEVKQGQLIAKLDPTDFQLVLDQAQARYDLALAQFVRSENLAKQGVVSPQQFDEVKANLEIARANRDTARANLNYSELRAPFAGTIAHVFVENFETVQPQRAIATLLLSDAMDISIRVPENLFARVQRNTDYQPEVRFSALPEQTFRATLKEWDSVADPASNTYRVVFTMPTPSEFNLLPGMSATVLVDSSAVSSRISPSPLVPASAVFVPTDRPTDSGPYVWLIDPVSATVALQAVTVGSVTSQGLEITTGLSLGDQIVSAGVHSLQAGQKVWSWQREPGL